MRTIVLLVAFLISFDTRACAADDIAAAQSVIRSLRGPIVRANQRSRAISALEELACDLVAPIG